MLKILFINQPGSEYLQSQLYYGLVKLGHSVWDLPNNHTFHFQSLENCDMNCKNGPCAQNNAVIGCNPHSAHLTLPKFDYSWKMEDCDLIVTNNGYGYENLYRDLAHKPIAVLDCGDSRYSSYSEWVKCIGRKPTAFFRREFLIGQDGGPDRHQLNFSFYDDRKKFLPYKDLKYNVSCMFRPTNPIRQEIIQHISKLPNVFIGQLKYPEYLERISESKFVIDLPGAAVTCVRTTEIAGRGSVIVRPHQKEIYIRNDFTSDICYETYDDMLEQLYFFIRNEREYRNLRLNSWAHFNAYHTCTARSLELLNAVGF